MKTIRLSDAESAIRQARRDLLSDLSRMSGPGAEFMRQAVLRNERLAVENMRSKASEPRLKEIRRELRSIIKRELGDDLDKSQVYNVVGAIVDAIRTGAWL